MGDMSHTDQELLVLRVAVFPPAPPDQFFDYLPPPGGQQVALGSRVRVTLRRRPSIGVVIESGVKSLVEESKLRMVDAVLDNEPVLSADLLELFQWTARYYQYPIGRVLCHTIPHFIRRGDALREGVPLVWEACGDAGARANVVASLSRAPVQQRLLALLTERGPLTEERLSNLLPGWRRPAEALKEKGLVTVCEQAKPSVMMEPSPHQLNESQSKVLARLTECDTFECHLIEGVTGSGKTEIYLRVGESVLDRGGQMLVLVPEIGLTSQTVSRFHERYGSVVAVFHSGMSNLERLHSWSRARTGMAKVIVGTRSAMFLPFKSLATIIVDEEHDISYKQQESLRYHARDLAIKRAQLMDIPIILGSATPSLESLCKAMGKQYCHHRLSQRAGDACMPTVEIIDLRGQCLTGGVSSFLIDKIKHCLAREEQVLLFLNRRGYTTQALCHDCGEVWMCINCDVPLVYHLNANAMRCHYCNYVSSRPKQCIQCGGVDFKDTGIGTERIEEELSAVFPHVGITRVDADVVRHKGELNKRLKEIHSSGARILIGTQMLSKGHHFPQVTLVGILNVDQRLFSLDFRAIERLGQLVVQVSGRAGRGIKPGKVCLQTYHPDNPYLLHLVQDGYADFARHLLTERKRAQLPPYYFLSLVRAEAEKAETATAFLKTVRVKMKPSADRHRVCMMGPSPMVFEKRDGRYRAQLLLSAASRASLNRCLNETLPVVGELKNFRRVVWHVDIDPVEIE